MDIEQTDKKYCWCCKANVVDISMEKADVKEAMQWILKVHLLKPGCLMNLCRPCAIECLKCKLFGCIVEEAYASFPENGEILLEDSHVRKPTSNGTFKCNDCERTFSRKGSLKTHQLTHPGLKPFVCNVCEKGFSRRTILNNHMRLHSGKKPFKCERCVLAFTTKYRLNTHIVRFHSENKTSSTRKYHCKTCNEEFSYHCEKKIHYETPGSKCFRHTTPNLETVSSESVADLPLVCANCNKKFLTLKDLLTHQEMHEGPTFECKHCTVYFNSETDLLYHKIKVHKEENDIINDDKLGFAVGGSNNTGMMKHECSICRKSFITGSSLKSHIRSVHTDEKPFRCSKCFKSFNRKNILSRTHTKNKPALLTHLNSSHEDNVVEILLYCSHCQDTFCAEKDLLDHTVAEHEGAKVEYICDICEDRFSDLQEYKVHVVTHNNSN